MDAHERAEALRMLRSFIGEKKDGRDETQEAWAARLGVSTRTVTSWETGTSPPRPKMLAKMLDLLHAQAALPDAEARLASGDTFTLEQLIADLTEPTSDWLAWREAFDLLWKPAGNLMMPVDQLEDFERITSFMAQLGNQVVVEGGEGTRSYKLIGNPERVIPSSQGEIVLRCQCGCRHRIRVSPAGQVHLRTAGTIEQVGAQKRKGA